MISVSKLLYSDAKVNFNTLGECYGGL